MGTVAAKLTTEQFLALPEKPGVKRELMEGEIVEMGTGGPIHERMKMRLIGHLVPYFAARGCFAVASETMYHLAPGIAYQPDVSVVLSGDLNPGGRNRITIAPDIAIEVVSSESAAYLRHKVGLYLQHGVSSVWLVYPLDGIVAVHKPGRLVELERGQTLADPELLPGFSITVDSLFEGIQGSWEEES
jgi:Uma2 family endonuclease